MPLVLLFPGQGSQSVGMAAGLADAYPEARAVFEEAEEAARLPLRQLMAAGPEVTAPTTRHPPPLCTLGSQATLAGDGDGDERWEARRRPWPPPRSASR